MTTIGDIFAITFALIGIGLTTWSLIVSCALFFPKKVGYAAVESSGQVRENLLLGLLMLLPTAVGVAMLSAPAPMLKLLGMFVILGALGLVAIGAAGLSHLSAERIRRMDSNLTDYGAFLRGSGFIVCASMLPFLGWFLFGPCVILASLGGGTRALARREAVQDRSFPSNLPA